MSTLTQRERQVLGLVSDNPLISQQAIADALCISRSAVAGHIARLTDKGVIKGRGYVISEAPFVVAIGGANMDIAGSPHRRLRLRDSNPGRVTTSPGGVARNIAENLSRLGVDCRLIAPVGNDHYGELLVRQGREAGIDMRHVLQLDGHATSTYLSVLDESGDMRMAISDMEILATLDGNQLEKHERMLRSAEALVVDLNLGDDALTYLAEHCAGRPLFVDTVSTTKALRIKPFLAAVHTIFPSRIEAEALSGLSGETPRDLNNMADWFHGQGVERVFVTLGQGGVFFSDGEERGTLPPPDAGSLVNTNGAGDAFAAGIISAWLNKRTLRHGVRFAMAAAAHTLRDSAAVSRTLSEATLEKLCESIHAA